MAAAALLQRLHISRPHDLQHLEDIAWAANALVREADLEGADGRHVRSGARSVITVKRGALRSRQRFTIAHELGHLELHPDAGDLSLCTESDVSEAPLESKEARTKREGEANDFAGHLLVPTLMLTPICRGRAPLV